MIGRAQLSVALAALLGLAACHSNGEGGLVEQSSEPPSPRQVASAQVDALAPALGQAVQARADAVPLLTLSDAGAFEAALADADPETAQLVTELYAARDQAPIFFVDSSATEAALTVHEVLADSWAQGLFPVDYGVETVEAAVAIMEAAHQTLAQPITVALSPAERDSLADALARRPDLLEADPSDLVIPVLDIILNPPDGEAPVAAALADAYNRRVAAIIDLGSASVEAELALTAGFLEYADDVRYANPEWLRNGEAEALGEADLFEARRAALREAFSTGAETGFQPVLDGLSPPYQQYTRLVEAHRQYRGIVEAGGWRTDLEETELRPGRSNDMVPLLRERLAAEDYYTGEDLTSREYDREIRHALELYQRTHQFRDNGDLGSGVVNSLNTPALRRAQQIAVTLQRWRESQITSDETYVFVNAPDFHAEVWREGVRDMRFRIIVGDTRRFVSSETGNTVYPRATPEVHATLRYVVFNPYWNVPPSIMINEYDPELEENPYWYQDNGYEVAINERGNRWVRQLPGGHNALGTVKFLFPNEHDVYLHDTPTRSLFERTQRTFSHGCMRIQDPMEFAYYLLEHDRGWERERIDEERGAEIFQGWREEIWQVGAAEEALVGALPADSPPVEGDTELPIDSPTTEDDTEPSPLAGRPIPESVPPVGRPFLPEGDEDYIDRWISLRNPIPVHVEYYVVRVDDDGFTNFLGDIYRRDQPLMAARAERELEEVTRTAGSRIESGVGVAGQTATQVAIETARSDHPEQVGDEAIDEDHVASE